MEDLLCVGDLHEALQLNSVAAFDPPDLVDRHLPGVIPVQAEEDLLQPLEKLLVHLLLLDPLCVLVLRGLLEGAIDDNGRHYVHEDDWHDQDDAHKVEKHQAMPMFQVLLNQGLVDGSGRIETDKLKKSEHGHGYGPEVVVDQRCKLRVFIIARDQRMGCDELDAHRREHIDQNQKQQHGVNHGAGGIQKAADEHPEHTKLHEQSHRASEPEHPDCSDLEIL
mmetsp:Transcript_7197/g.20245  ORF Transcript_7197/g.20245 Transcript_7197/m.20245 type:complete len:222 (-) Transcript_7197:439-1104(-)